MYLQFDDGLDSCETNKMGCMDLVQNKSKLNNEYTDDGILLLLLENIWVNELQNCHIWKSNIHKQYIASNQQEFGVFLSYD